jgi:predicted RNA methylase
VLAGGLKIWECTRDLADFLIREGIDLTGKRVLDLGCGTGLLGILAMHLGAESVHFQDYVSEHCTGLGGAHNIASELIFKHLTTCHK